MRFRSAALGVALLAAPIVATPMAARAQPFQGFYLDLGAGYSMPEDVNVKVPGGRPMARLKSNGGVVGLLGAGYGFGNGVRLELEGGALRAGLSRFTSAGVTGTVSGSAPSYFAMANAMFDMDIGANWIYPYIGAGAGYAWTTLHNVTLTIPPGSAQQITGSQGSFAAQAIAGLSFPMPGVPGLSVTTEYRFIYVSGNRTFQNVTRHTILTSENLDTHNFLLGVRYAFNVAPPAVEAAPTAVPAAVVPARSYLVFFDWDKATLTDRARAIVREAANASSKVQTTRIEVNGNADTSGTAAYNQGLSMRRAQAVAAELVKDGVPKAAISIQAFGDTKLLVATGPGVREPQNRRVEIVLH